MQLNRLRNYPPRIPVRLNHVPAAVEGVPCRSVRAGGSPCRSRNEPSSRSVVRMLPYNGEYKLYATLDLLPPVAATLRAYSRFSL